MNSFRIFLSSRAGAKLLKVPKSAVVSVLAVGVGTAVCSHNFDYVKQSFPFTSAETNPFFLNAVCASPLKPQDSVITETKQHALYLTIHVKPDASPAEIIKALSKIESFIDKICPKDLRDEDSEILAGVGFGPNFLKRVYPNAKANGVENFTYEHRKGGAANMPATGGDIFIHAKCHERGKLFELAQAVMNAMPAKSVDSFEDNYGWVYRYGRDLSGFIDGTENPADADHRADVAINPKTGGSFTITQRWVHKHNVINSTSDAEMDKWIGRRRSDSVELPSPKPASSHVARVTGRTDPKASKKPFQIVRQSMPYGTLSKESGLFFIAYAKTPQAFDYMLDQMAGATADGLYDHVFHLTECKTGSYFYFPSQDELKAIYSGKAGDSPGKWWNK